MSPMEKATGGRNVGSVFGNLANEKSGKFDYRQEISEGNPFEAGVQEWCAHRMDLFNPYQGQNVYSTVYGNKKYQGDHILASEGILVYDYLTLPALGSDDDVLLNLENPSTHMPIGINFSI